MIEQKSWRRIASVCLLLSGSMAIYAVVSDVLRDSLVYLVQLLSNSENELGTSTPFWTCFLYWSVFALLVTITVYIGLIDFKYIRLKFALERRKLMEQTVGSEEMQDLLKRAGVNDNVDERNKLD